MQTYILRQSREMSEPLETLLAAEIGRGVPERAVAGTPSKLIVSQDRKIECSELLRNRLSGWS